LVQKNKYKCCCPKDIKIKIKVGKKHHIGAENNEDIIYRPEKHKNGWFGHKHEGTATTKSVKAETSGDCSLIVVEENSVSSDFDVRSRNSKAKVIILKPGEKATVDKFSIHPGNSQSIGDSPRLTLGGGIRGKREIRHIITTFTLSKSASCKCDKDSISLTVEQHLEVLSAEPDIDSSWLKYSIR
jgi:hypothetical protein